MNKGINLFMLFGMVQRAKVERRTDSGIPCQHALKKGFMTVRLLPEAEIEEVRLLNKRLEKWLLLALKNDPEAMEIMGYREYGD